MGLWADGWFYISSAGFLVSGVLFFFLLGQYRAASAAADATETEPPEISVAAVHPVFVHEKEQVHEPIASIPTKPVEPKAAEPKAPEKDPANTTASGISPAVVYLQNIKSELAELHQEMRDLAKRVDTGLSGTSTRDEALIERLGELTRTVEELKAAAAAAPVAAAPAPAPVVEAQTQVRSIEIEVPAPAPKAEPEFEMKTEPAPKPDETMRVQLSAVVDAHVAEKQAPVAIAPVEPPVAEPAPAEPAVLEAPAPEAKPRRGPVWPV